MSKSIRREQTQHIQCNFVFDRFARRLRLTVDSRLIGFWFCYFLLLLRQLATHTSNQQHLIITFCNEKNKEDKKHSPRELKICFSLHEHQNFKNVLDTRRKEKNLRLLLEIDLSIRKLSSETHHRRPKKGYITSYNSCNVVDVVIPFTPNTEQKLLGWSPYKYRKFSITIFHIEISLQCCRRILITSPARLFDGHGNGMVCGCIIDEKRESLDDAGVIRSNPSIQIIFVTIVFVAVLYSPYAIIPHGQIKYWQGFFPALTALWWTAWHFIIVRCKNLFVLNFGKSDYYQLWNH